MNFYRLKELNDLPNILYPKFPSSTEIWSKTEPIFITGSVRNEQQDIDFLSFYYSGIMSNAFLISSQAWEIWRGYQIGGRCRPCAFGHMAMRQARAYYLLLPKILDVLHPDTVYMRDGTIESICLSRELVGWNQVFVVRGATQMELIISESILEEMIRSNITQFYYEQVEVVEGGSV